MTGKKTRKSALGGDTGNLDSNTIFPGIGGVGGDQTGSKLSESNQISKVVKETD